MTTATSKIPFTTLATVVLAPMTAFGAQYCMQPVIKLISASFGRGAEGAGVIMSAAMLGMALTLFVLIGISDRLPVKKCVVGALFFAAAATIAAPLINSFYLFFAVRVLQGAILSVIPVLVISYARRSVVEELAGYAVSLYVCGVTIGGLSGRLSMSFLTDLVGWRQGMLYLGSVYVVFACLVLFLMQPDDQLRVEQAKDKEGGSIFCRENLPLVGVCALAFCFSGCYFPVFNYVPYVFSVAPYNFSNTVIGMFFAIQLFGTLGSFIAGKMHAKLGAGKIVAIGLAMILAGIWTTTLVPAVVKIAGLIMLTMGFYAMYAMIGGLAGKVAVRNKAGATAAFMFCSYMGGTFFSVGSGYAFASIHWWGLVVQVTAEVIVCGAILGWLKKYL